MVEGYRADRRLTPEANTARLIVARFNLEPGFDVFELAKNWATIEVDAIPVSTDAVVLHHPKGDRKPQIILNRNSTSLEERRRFTLGHEIGHILIPWHGGSIACHVDENTVQVSSDHYNLEAEANRFASELLMPTPWIERVVEEEISVGKIFNRIVKDAKVSVSAARIKLVEFLPPGFVCVEYDRRSSEVSRVECSTNTSLGLFLKLSETRDLPTIIRKLDTHAVDGCTITRGLNELRFWRLECREDLPRVLDPRNSAELLRELVRETFPQKDWEFHTRAIFSINGHSSRANSVSPSREAEVIFGTMKLIFSHEEVVSSSIIKASTMHPNFEWYMAEKSLEMSRRTRVKGPRKK